MTTETVILLFQLGCAGIALHTLWLIHAPVALALTALLKAGARWLDSSGGARIRKLEQEIEAAHRDAERSARR